MDYINWGIWPSASGFNVEFYEIRNMFGDKMKIGIRVSHKDICIPCWCWWYIKRKDNALSVQYSLAVFGQKNFVWEGTKFIVV